MRFVHVNHRYAPFVGGSERWIQEVSENLAGHGHDVVVVTSDAFDLEYLWDRHRTRVSAPSRERIGGVEIERVEVRHLPMSSIVFRGSRRLMGEVSRIPSPAFPFQLLSRIQPFMPGLNAAIGRSLPAALIHATNIGLESLAIRSMDAARAGGAKFVLTPFIHLGTEGDPVARRFVSMPHQRALMRSADAIMVMTEAEKEFVRSIRGSDNGIAVTGAGVNVHEVSGGNGAAFRTLMGLNGFLVGSLGAMARDKGTFTLAQSIIELRRSGTDIHLVLAGPPLQEFVRWYTGLTDNEREGIHVVGFVSADIKRDLLAAIDVLALPSRTESFGIVYLEAWANCKPVVAADTSATRELIEDGVSGVLVPFGSVEAVSHALRDLMTDPRRRERMGFEGYCVAAHRFTWEKVTGRVADVYSEVLGVDVLEQQEK